MCGGLLQLGGECLRQWSGVWAPAAAFPVTGSSGAQVCDTTDYLPDHLHRHSPSEATEPQLRHCTPPAQELAVQGIAPLPEALTVPQGSVLSCGVISTA